MDASITGAGIFYPICITALKFVEKLPMHIALQQYHSVYHA